MTITGMNHAVLYARDCERQRGFSTDEVDKVRYAGQGSGGGL